MLIKYTVQNRATCRSGESKQAFYFDLIPGSTIQDTRAH